MKGKDEKNRCKPFATQTNTALLDFIHEMLQNVAELTLAPYGDQILPVRSQEPADQCLSS